MVDDLAFKPMRGTPPTLEWVGVDVLEIDAAYQRSVDSKTSRALIRSIAQRWDWSLCQPLAVSRRVGGRLFVVDGQHRLCAAMLRGDIPHLPCVVIARSALEEEATVFVALNERRRPLSSVDIFRASLAAGDAAAHEVMDIISSCGLEIAPHQNWTAWKPGQLWCIPTIASGYRLYGRVVTSAALSVVSTAWSNDVLRFAGTILGGLIPFFANEMREGESFDPDIVEEVLCACTQAEWVAKGQMHSAVHGASRRDAMLAVFTNAYVDRLRLEVEAA